MPLAIVEADETRRSHPPVAAIGRDDVRESVAVEIRERHVSRAPFRSAERAELREVPLPVITVNQLAIRLVVADDDVQLSVSIHIRQGRRVGPIRRRPEVTGHEAALPVVEQDTIEKRPVAPLSKHDIEKSVAVEVADVDTGRSFARLFE